MAQELKTDKAFAFDIEVTRTVWVAVIKQLGTNKVIKLVNDMPTLKKIFIRNRNNLWIGFKNSKMDNLLFASILVGINPYDCYNTILYSGDVLKAYEMSSVNDFLKNFTTWDVASVGIRGSLSEFAGFLGMPVQSMPVDIKNRDGYSDEEIDCLIDYTSYRVSVIEKLAEIRFSILKSKVNLMNEFGIDRTYLSKSNAKLTAEVLHAQRIIQDDELAPYVKPDFIKVDSQGVIDYYASEQDYMRESLRIELPEQPDLTLTYGYGGVHGAIRAFHSDKRMLQIDATSYYVQLMTNYNIMSRAILGNNRNKFSEMYDKRVEAKSKYEDSSLDEATREEYAKISQAMKLPLVNVFGASKDKFNKLYDPRIANLITITGQLLLTDLIEKLDQSVTVVNVNTDGLLVIVNDEDAIKYELDKFYKRTHITFEIDEVSEVWQRDVNNYIIKYPNGSYKVKGSLLSQADTGEKIKSANEFQSSASIIADAVFNGIVHNISVRDTVMKEKNNIAKFQIIKRVDKKKYRYVKQGSRLIQMTNRYFATKKPTAQISKYNATSGQKVENMPEHVIVDNHSIADIKIDKLDIDYEWYINEAQKGIDSFTTGMTFDNVSDNVFI